MYHTTLLVRPVAKQDLYLWNIVTGTILKFKSTSTFSPWHLGYLVSFWFMLIVYLCYKFSRCIHYSTTQLPIFVSLYATLGIKILNS